MKDYIDLAQSHFFTFAIGYTFGVRKVGVRILFVRDENEKCRQKCRPNGQPTTHPTHQTNQPVKNKKLRRAQGGEQESY
jgi:hypothetical protein